MLVNGQSVCLLSEYLNNLTVTCLTVCLSVRLLSDCHMSDYLNNLTVFCLTVYLSAFCLNVCQSVCLLSDYLNNLTVFFVCIFICLLSDCLPVCLPSLCLSASGTLSLLVAHAGLPLTYHGLHSTARTLHCLQYFGGFRCM